MKLNRFKIRIIIQSVLIAILGYLTVDYLVTEHLWITRITIFLAWIFLLASMINYVSRTNRMLNAFLDSVKYLDMIPSRDEGDKSFRDLNLSLNQIISGIKEAKRDKEAQSVYFRNIVEHVDTGLISYDKEGKIRMYNRAAKELLSIPILREVISLQKIKPGLDSQVTELETGKNLLTSIIINNELHRIIIRKAEMIIMGEKLFVISLQDIRTQLEEEELETWQKLISILRHEIMNSVAPLNSLSLSLRKITEKIKSDIPQKDAEMLVEGLESISRRSDGLMNFVQDYRTLTSIPKPVFTEFYVEELIRESIVLFKPEFKKQNISLVQNIKPELKLTADFNLVSQILINLVKNAIESIVHDEGKLLIEAFRKEPGYLYIMLQDNGKGIEEEEREKIFLPFYTTKENGSGIGLSLARQIMRLHKGSINLTSKPGKGSTFTLQF